MAFAVHQGRRPSRSLHVTKSRSLRAEGLAALDYTRRKVKTLGSAVICCPAPLHEWCLSVKPEISGRLFTLICDTRLPLRDAQALSHKLADMDVCEIDYGNSRDGFQISWFEPTQTDVAVAA